MSARMFHGDTPKPKRHDTKPAVPGVGSAGDFNSGRTRWYWSSSPNDDNNAWNANFNNGNVNDNNVNNDNNVRCVRSGT